MWEAALYGRPCKKGHKRGVFGARIRDKRVRPVDRHDPRNALVRITARNPPSGEATEFEAGRLPEEDLLPADSSHENPRPEGARFGPLL